MKADQAERIRGLLALELTDKNWILISERLDHTSDLTVSQDIPVENLINVLENVIIKLKEKI